MSGLTIKDYRKIIRNNIAFIIFIGLILAIFTGGYRLLSGMKSVSSGESAVNNAGYEAELEAFNAEKDSLLAVEKRLEKNIGTAWKTAEENPIMLLDSGKCEYELLTINYVEPNISRNASVKQFISQMDEEQLFGDSNDILKTYKNDIVFVPYNNKDLMFESKGQTAVFIFDTDLTDSSIISENLKKALNNKGEIGGAKISSVDIAHMTGDSQTLYYRQREIRLNAYNMQDDLRKIKEQDRLLAAPTPAQSGPSKVDIIKSSIKAAIAGLILGIAAGIAVVLFTALNSGVILSKEQFDDLFDMDNLGVIASNNHDYSIEIANSESLSKDHRKVMILSAQENQKAYGFTEQLKKNTEVSDKFVYGSDIINNQDTLYHIIDTDGVILVIEKGKDSVTDIQKIMKRLGSFKKEILGYLMIE